MTEKEGGMIFEIEDIRTMHKALEELSAFLLDCGFSEDRIFDGKLIACELLGNVLRHSQGKATLYGERKDNFVELKVFSSIPFMPPEKSKLADTLSEHGRGIFLVDALSDGRATSKDGAILIKLEIR